MASFWCETALKKILDGTINPQSDTLKVALLNSTCVPGKADTFMDDGTSDDPNSGEIVATNYTGGHGGAGRKTLSPTFSVDTSGHKAYIVFSNVTWTALGGATNDTVTNAVVFKPGTSDDTTAAIIAYWDLTDTPTNGSDFTLTMDGSAGNLQITT